MSKIKTIIEVLEFFVKNRPELSEAYVINMNNFVHIFVNDTCQCELYKINSMAIVSWKKKVLLRTSATTWNTYLRHMKALFNFALEQKAIKKNPFHESKTITTNIRSKKTLTDKELLVMFDFLRGNYIDISWFWLIVSRFFYYHAVRRKTLCLLEWRDVDFLTNTVRVRPECNKTKTENWIPLHKDIINDLRFLQKKTGFVTNGIGENKQIFNVTLFSARHKNKNMLPEQVSGFYKKLSKHLGFKVSAHRFRHTAATKIVNSEFGDLKTAQSILDHSDIRTTLEYVHPDMERLRDVLEATIVPI